jgi:hypothetical protein
MTGVLRPDTLHQIIEKHIKYLEIQAMVWDRWAGNGYTKLANLEETEMNY